MLRCVIAASFACVLCGGLGILNEAKIHVDCGNASGGLSCDWQCYDACVAPHNAHISVKEFKECMKGISHDCLIPGMALVSIAPDWFCSTPSAAENASSDTQSYGLQFPSTGDRESNIQLYSHATRELSVDIEAEFDSAQCRSLIRYSVGTGDVTATHSVCSKCLSMKQEFAVASFGLHTVNLNISEWAKSFETENSFDLGDKALTLELSTLGSCWAPATNMTLYHEMKFKVRPSGSDGIGPWTSVSLGAAFFALLF